MNWNYEDKLTEYIAQAQHDSGVGQDFVFHVYTEQVFAKQELKPNDIYVVIKYLSTDNTLNATTRPIQIIVLCEQNQLQETQIIFSKLVETHNFEAGIYDTTYIKQDYRDPVVLSNFNEVSYGYRSIIYVSATLFVMENVIDVKNVKIGFDNVFQDLTSDQITVKNALFAGQKGYPQSPKYVVEVDKLLARFEELGSTGAPVFVLTCWKMQTYFDEGGMQFRKVPLLKVNETLCSNIEFNLGTCILRDADDNYIATIWYNQVSYFTIQYQNTENISDIDFHSAGDAQILPYVVTQYFGDISRNAYEESIKPINFNIAYSMTPNTQPIPPEKIATSVKSVATFSISLTTAMTSEYQYVDYVSEIMKGDYSGNLNFYLSFDLGNVSFTRVPMKLISAQITTAIDQVPGLQIGLLK